MQFPLFMNRPGKFAVEIAADGQVVEEELHLQAAGHDRAGATDFGAERRGVSPPVYLTLWTSTGGLTPRRSANAYNTHHEPLTRSDSDMSNLAEQIARFRKMAQEDPDNELGHFRLGQLLMEDGQYAEAAKSFERHAGAQPAVLQGVPAARRVPHQARPEGQGRRGADEGLDGGRRARRQDAPRRDGQAADRTSAHAVPQAAGRGGRRRRPRHRVPLPAAGVHGGQAGEQLPAPPVPGRDRPAHLRATSAPRAGRCGSRT